MSNEWQPIETAPKDGTWILCCDTEWDEIIIARWECLRQWNDPRDVFGWVEKGECNIVINPTHWMPLPKPPEQ